MKKRRSNKEIGEGIEELLTRLRKQKGWSYIDLLMKLDNKELTEKDIRKWEAGLKYPDLDMIYELSALYRVPATDFVQAKNNSYEKGLNSVNMILVKWVCYLLKVSYRVAIVILILFYTVALIGSLIFFKSACDMVVESWRG